LLCAPLIQAVYDYPQLPLQQALHNVLATTRVDDANWTFKAIALASPGGLGETNQQDVHESATVTLRQAMSLAASKDRIALQYLTDFQDIFAFCCLTYYNALAKWGGQNWATVAVYAHYLSQFSDSHIERKYGDRFSAMVTDRMATVYDALGKTDNPEHIMPLLYDIDCEFKDAKINPGTTADMTVATVLIVTLLNAGKQTVSFGG
jgi:triphosphoribosyl-dephospho-CoA synthase